MRYCRQFATRISSPLRQFQNARDRKMWLQRYSPSTSNKTFKTCELTPISWLTLNFKANQKLMRYQEYWPKAGGLLSPSTRGSTSRISSPKRSLRRSKIEMEPRNPFQGECVGPGSQLQDRSLSPTCPEPNPLPDLETTGSISTKPRHRQIQARDSIKRVSNSIRRETKSSK
jgi:hypothetical protein